VKLERAGKSLRARCPFHTERTASFYVSPERGTYYCFGCGEKGDIFSFVEKLDGVDFRDALKLLAERAGVELEQYRGEKGPTRDEKERLYELHEAAVAYFVETLNSRADVREYLSKRGLADATIDGWRLGYALPEWRTLTEHLRKSGFTDQEILASGLAIEPRRESSESLTTHNSQPPTKSIYDRFRGRIMFPIFDVGGRPIAFSGISRKCRVVRKTSRPST
jgi:DNA primase